MHALFREFDWRNPARIPAIYHVQPPHSVLAILLADEDGNVRAEAETYLSTLSSHERLEVLMAASSAKAE
ncbi:hypothetical protein WV31_10650 [Magnetospirillum sp. ME-1]|nr:hypothetical protein WV31_10650 [Magnetospirillum sp. ME-1]